MQVGLLTKAKSKSVLLIPKLKNKNISSCMIFENKSQLHLAGREIKKKNWNSLLYLVSVIIIHLNIFSFPCIKFQNNYIINILISILWRWELR